MAGGFPTRALPRFDTTGKVLPVTQQVLAEDDFKRPGDMCGFTSLWTPPSVSNCGSVGWIDRGGTPRVYCRANTQLSGEAMAVKRMNNLFGNGRLLLEMLVSIEFLSLNGQYPRSYAFGLDTCLEDGTRRFFQVRMINYDETAAAVSGKLYVDMGGINGITSAGAAGGSLIAVPGNPVFPRVVNENKALPFYIALEVDMAGGKYLGLRFGNGVKVGSLADVPATALADLGVVTPGSLPSYIGGVNTCLSVENRSSGTKTKGQINCHFHRLTYLGV